MLQEPDLAARVAAVYTWGEPRVGDSNFRDVFNAAYGDRCFRVRNAGQANTVKCFFF
jgi:Lipase (class 3)